MKLNSLLVSLYITLLSVGAVYATAYAPDNGKSDEAVAEAKAEATSTPPLSDLCTLDVITCPNQEKIYATVTAYALYPQFTDATPCIGAGGNICERNDAIACPRRYKLGTKVIIGGVNYVCLDRLNIKYDNRFDISFGKDIAGAKKFGKRQELVTIIYD